MLKQDSMRNQLANIGQELSGQEMIKISKFLNCFESIEWLIFNGAY